MGQLEKLWHKADPGEDATTAIIDAMCGAMLFDGEVSREEWTFGAKALLVSGYFGGPEDVDELLNTAFEALDGVDANELIEGIVDGLGSKSEVKLAMVLAIGAAESDAGFFSDADTSFTGALASALGLSNKATNKLNNMAFEVTSELEDIELDAEDGDFEEDDFEDSDFEEDDIEEDEVEEVDEVEEDEVEEDAAEGGLLESLVAFLIHSADGTIRALFGYKPAGPPEDAPRYEGVSDRDWALPPKVDLRPHMSAIEQQGETNSCVANAVAGAYEYLVSRHLDDDAYDVSRLFIYFNGRHCFNLREGSGEDAAIEDQGTFIQDAIKAVQEYGACSEETWPFEKDLVNDQPDDGAYDEASSFLIDDCAVVPTDLNLWKECLAEGYPIVFGTSLFQSFDKHRRPGLIPMPSSNERARADHGGHAMLCVGYSDADEVFIVRNSWGTDWGDEGNCYMPYAYLMDPELNDGDSWMFRKVQELEVGGDVWGDHAPLLDEVATEWGQMSDDAFGDLLDACHPVPPETRIALLMLCAAGADGHLSDHELQQIAAYLDHTLDTLGVQDLNTHGLIRKAEDTLDEGGDALVYESAEILGEHLSERGLGALFEQILLVANVDGFGGAEEDFLIELSNIWDIEA